MFTRTLLLALALAAISVPALASERQPTEQPLELSFEEKSDPYEIAPGLRWSISFRGRYEDRRNFRFGTGAGNIDSYYLFRNRIGLQYSRDPNWTLFAEAQVSTVRGDSFVNSEAVPNAFEDDLDINQLYLEVRGSGNTVKAGRQRLTYGDHRLIGAGEWSNNARGFDAVKVVIGDPKKSSLDLFAAKPIANNPKDWNDWRETGSRAFDSVLYGAVLNSNKVLPAGNLQAYYLLRTNNLMDDDVHTVGFLASRSFGALSFDAEVAGQFGTFSGDEHRAFAGHAGLKYKLGDQGNTTLNAMFNFATGDDDPTDGVHETFDNLYPTNHMHYGEMDFFAWMNMKNIEIGITRTFGKWTARAEYHWFWLAEPSGDNWYSASGSVIRPAPGVPTPSFVGNELDFILQFKASEFVEWQFGYSHFFPGSYISATGTDRPADFFYASVFWKL